MRSGNFQILMPPAGGLVCSQPFRRGVGVELADLGVFILWQSRVWGSGPERWC